jgi:uncharacterized protein YdaU (DUF1376 family)
MNYYPHHIGDYLRDTSHLTVLEDGTYRRMLDLYYASEKPLPLDFEWLTRLVRARENPEREAVHFILEKFFVKMEDGWHNKRADEEIRKDKVRVKAAKRNGKLGGRPKTQRVSKNNPAGLHVANPGQSSQNQPQNHIKTRQPPPDGGSTVWDFGKSLLTEQGLSSQSAGALIGSWLREWSEPEVADALRSAAGKADIRGYVAAILKTKPKKGAQAAAGVAMP